MQTTRSDQMQNFQQILTKQECIDALNQCFLKVQNVKNNFGYTSKFQFTNDFQISYEWFSNDYNQQQISTLQEIRSLKTQLSEGQHYLDTINIIFHVLQKLYTINIEKYIQKIDFFRKQFIKDFVSKTHIPLKGLRLIDYQRMKKEFNKILTINYELGEENQKKTWNHDRQTWE